MASFVREVLSAAGTLGDKEDLAAKMLKIRKKLMDLKSQLQTHIEARYGSFASSLAATSLIASQLERLRDEVQQLDTTIAKYYKTELIGCNQELSELNSALQELQLTLQVVERIKTCYDQIEESNEHVASGKWLLASQGFQKSLTLIRSPCFGLDADSVRIIPALQKELVSQQEKLLRQLRTTWQHTVLCSTQNITKGKQTSTTNSLTIRSDGHGKEKIAELVQALAHIELLDDLLVPLVSQLRSSFIAVLVGQSCSLDSTQETLTVTYSQEKDRQEPREVFSRLKILVHFLTDRLDVSLGGSGEEAETLLQRLGSSLASWLCDTLIRDVLAPSVPSSVEKLPEYDAVIAEAEELQDCLVGARLLPPTNITILNYTRNVDALFANKLSQELLTTARNIMKEDLFVTVAVNEDKVEALPQDIKEEAAEEEEELAVPPSFPLPDQLFQFPACSVSASTVRLMEVAVMGGLEQAVATKQAFCSVRLFNTVRNVLELWCAVVPTYHRVKLESLPQLAAVAHNSAMYLAHRCLTLGFLYRDRLPAVAPHSLTFTDIVPRLRDVGAQLLLRSMRLQRDQLLQTLATAGFASSGSDRRLYSGVEQGVRQVLHQLAHLQKVWQPVLPPTVYNRCIGTLLNSALEEIIHRIVNLADISAEAAGQFSSLLQQIRTRAPQLFEAAAEPVERYVKRWNKFLELVVVLDASLREIEERWGEGRGRLAQHFPPEEVKMLIRAIFQNTERRAAVLAKIK